MSPLLRLLPLVVLLAASAPGQELNEKAARYYETLRKRPSPGPAFDRFVEAWLDSGTLEQLESWLTTKIQAEPSAGTHLLLGLYHVRQGAHAKAVDQYRAALALEPDNAAIWQQQALAESRLLEFDQAISSLEKGLAKQPDETTSLAMRQLLGRLLSRAGRTGDALTVWQKLMAERPDDEALREDVLELQLAEGLFDAAVENAAALVERAPDAYKKAMRRLQSAEVLDRAGRSDAAQAEMEKCLADSGADSWLEKEVLARLDRIFRRDDNLSGLRKHLEALMERQPQRQGLQRARVRLLAELGEKTAAVEAGRTLLALAPGDRAAREEFIALLVEAGRLEEAVAQTAELVRQAPQDRELLLKLAALKLQAGDKNGCLAAVMEFDKLSGPDESARLRSAALLEKAGLVEEAIARLRAAAQEFPASNAVSGALASTLHKARHRDEALAEWKRQAAAASGPSFQDVARALAAHGEDEAAWELLMTRAETGDAPLLQQMCQLAERLDRADDVLPHARRLVSMAQSAPDMEAALETASRLIKRAGEADSVIGSIGADATVADLCLLSELLELRGDSSAAEEALRRAAQGSPDLAAAQLVRLYRMRQAWPEALEAGAKLFALPGGKRVTTAQMLADIAERARNLDAALHWTREWRKLSPGAAPAVLAESRLLRQTGKDDAALQTLRLASGQFEENTEIREELARLSRDTGRISEALSLYAALYEHSSDTAAKLRTVREWAEAAQEANRIAELLEQFEERRRQNRNATGPLLALAEIHGVNGDREKQRRVLTDATQLRPDDVDLALSLAAMQAEDDLIPLAVETLRAALPHDKSGRVRHRLARLHFDAGEQAEGMLLLEEPEAGSPPDAAAVESMAVSMSSADPERALALLASRIAADPSDYRLRYLHAHLRSELGQQAEAVREWGELLSIRQEVPAVAARRGAAIFSPEAEAELKQYAGSVPEEILEALRVSDLVSASNRRQMMNARYSGLHQTPGQAHTQLPGSLAELRALCAASLLAMNRPEHEMAKLAAEALTKAGQAEMIGLIEVSAEDLDPFAQPVPRRFAEPKPSEENKKESPLRDGLKVLESLTSGEANPLPSSRCLTIWNLYRHAYPGFALATVVSSLGNSPVPEDHEREAVDEFLKLARPSGLVLSSAVQYLKQGGVRRWDASATHGRIIERVLTWLESDWISAPALANVRRDLTTQVLARKGDVPEIVARVLNAEWPREERNPSPASQSAQLRTGRGAFLDPLVWLPERIPGVSPVFGRKEGGLGTVGELNRSAAGKTATLVKYPVLRAWLEDRAANEGHPLPALTRLASEPNADPAALTLAAVSAAEAEKFTEAAQLAARALERPLAAEMRRQLNASIVSWAEESIAEHGSPLHTAAREAALRLRRDAQTYEQKAELAAAMESLGLAKEAEALQSGAAGSGWMNFNMAYYRGQDPGASRLQMMMRDAKRELKAGDAGAAATAAKVLRRQARHLLSPGGWSGAASGAPDARYFTGSAEDEVNWADLLKLMREKKAEEKILAALTQGTGSEPRQRAVLAAAREIMDQTQIAADLYREVIAAGTTNPGVHVRLALLLRKTEQQPELEKVFAGAPPEAQAWLAAHFLSKGERETLEAVQRASSMTLAALERREPALTAHFDWLNIMVTLLREDLEMSANLRAPRLEGPVDQEPIRRPNRPDASAREIQAAKEQLAARRKTHEALCRKLLQVPGTAAIAFHGLRTASPQDTDLSAEAVTAYVTECRYPAATLASHFGLPQQSALMRLMLASRGDGSDGFGLVTPPAVNAEDALYYLLDHCVKQNQTALMRETLIPALQKAGAARMAEQTALMTALYFDSAERVEENARRLVATGGAAIWPAVVRGLEHRHAQADLSALVVAELSRTRSRPDDLPLATAAAAEYCTWLCREGRQAQGRALLERVLDVLTGSARQRATAFSSAMAGGFNNYINALTGSGRGMGSPPAMHAMEPLKRLISTPATTFIALDTLYESVMPVLTTDMASGLAQQLDVLNAPFTKPDYFKDTERARQFFTNSPLVADVAQFRSYGGGTGLFFTVAGALYEMGFEERKPVLGVLRALPAAFGRDLLIAACTDRWNSDALNKAAEKFADIKTLPPPAQAEVSDLLAALASGRDTVNLTDAAQAMMKWVREQQAMMMSEETTKRIEDFVTARTGTGSGGLRNSQAAGSAGLLRAAIKGMSPRAYDVVRRVSVTVPRASAPERMGWLLAGYDDESDLLLYNSGGHSRDGMSPLPPDRSAFRLGVLTNTLAAGDKRMPLFIEPLRLALPRTVRWITDKLTGSPGERFTALTSAVAAQVKEGEACVLLEAFPMPVTSADTEDGRAALRAAAIAWAEGEGKSLPRQDIVREIAAAARLEQFIGTAPHAAGISDEAALPAEQAHYLSVMRDESRGPAARLAVASVLADFAGPWLEPPLVAEAAGILERTIATRRPLEPWQRSVIVRTVSRSAPAACIDAPAKALLPRIPFNDNLKEMSDREPAKHHLALALRANDSEAVARALAALQAKSGDPDALGLILATGDATRIANILRDAETKLYEPSFIGGEVQFDQRIADALAGALPGVVPEILRLRVELSAHALPSGPGMKERAERMREIAVRSQSVIEAAPAEARNGLLYLLTVEPTAALPFRQFYGEETDRKFWKDILQLKSTEWPNYKTRFWMVCLFAEAADGDVPALTARMDACMDGTGADPFSAHGVDLPYSVHEAALHHLCTGVAHGWPGWNAAQRNAVQQWLLGRMKAETLPGAEGNNDTLSLLPEELIKAINAEVP